MTREQRLERTEKVEHMIVLPHACELDHRRHTFLGGRAQTCKTRRTIIGTFGWRRERRGNQCSQIESSTHEAIGSRDC